MRLPIGSGSLCALVLALLTTASSMGSVGQAEAGESYGVPDGKTVLVAFPAARGDCASKRLDNRSACFVKSRTPISVSPGQQFR